MIHEQLLTTIHKERRQEQFLYPFYGSYSIAEIIPTIFKQFGLATLRKTLELEPLSENQKYRAVVLLVIDGLGYKDFVAQTNRLPFFQRLAQRGNVYPLTSVFPSTTSAALTALHTGLTPQEHGLPEWNVYFEEFDSIIETLPFRPMAHPVSDSLVEQGGKSEMLYEGTTAYEQLKQAGIESLVFIFEDYANTIYSRSVHRGAQLVPFTDGLDFTAKIKKHLRELEKPTYFFAYWGKIDSVAHEYGPGTNEHTKAIEEFSRLLEEKLFTKLDEEHTKDILFLVTADHGQVNIKGEEIINLNKYPEIDRHLAISKAGKRILPTGSPHDVFLYIEESKKDHVIHQLEKELEGRAEIMTTVEAVQRGLFGLNAPTKTFLRRIGNVLILPCPGQHVWYEFFPDIPYRQLGIHGGLSQDEMLVPFAITTLDAMLN